MKALWVWAIRIQPRMNDMLASIWVSALNDRVQEKLEMEWLWLQTLTMSRLPIIFSTLIDGLWHMMMMKKVKR